MTEPWWTSALDKRCPVTAHFTRRNSQLLISIKHWLVVETAHKALQKHTCVRTLRHACFYVVPHSHSGPFCVFRFNTDSDAWRRFVIGRWRPCPMASVGGRSQIALPALQAGNYTIKKINTKHVVETRERLADEHAGSTDALTTTKAACYFIGFYAGMHQKYICIGAELLFLCISWDEIDLSCDASEDERDVSDRETFTQLEGKGRELTRLTFMNISVVLLRFFDAYFMLCRAVWYFLSCLGGIFCFQSLVCLNPFV